MSSAHTPHGAPFASYRWWVLALIVVVNSILFGFGWSHLIMLVPILVEDLRIDLSEWGILWSSVSLGALLIAIPAGALADRFGVRRAGAAGILLASVSLLMRNQVSDFGSMLASMLLFGGALGTLIATLPKTLAIWFPPERLGLTNGIAMAGFGIGFTGIGFGLPSLLEGFGGWRGLSHALGWLSVGLACLWLLAIRDGTTARLEAPQRTLLAGMRDVLRVRDLWLLTLAYAVYYAGYMGTIGYLPTYAMQAHAMSEQATGVLVTLSAWAYIAGALLLPALSDRIGLRKGIYVFSMALTGFAVVSLAFFTGIPLALATVTWGLFSGARVLLLTVPPEMRQVGQALAGSSVGIAISGGFLGGLLGPTIGMELVDFGPFLGFAFWGGCYVLSALLFTAIRETGPAVR